MREERHATGAAKARISERSGTIVICDDDSEMRDALRYFLERRGHVVVETGGGDELLVTLQSVRADAVILDLLMPGGNGWETLARIRADPAMQGLPVIAATILARHDFETSAGGFTAWLEKPIEESQLLETVHGALRGASPV